MDRSWSSMRPSCLASHVHYYFDFSVYSSIVTMLIQHCPMSHRGSIGSCTKLRDIFPSGFEVSNKQIATHVLGAFSIADTTFEFVLAAFIWSGNLKAWLRAADILRFQPIADLASGRPTSVYDLRAQALKEDTRDFTRRWSRSKVATEHRANLVYTNITWKLKLRKETKIQEERIELGKFDGID